MASCSVTLGQPCPPYCRTNFRFLLYAGQLAKLDTRHHLDDRFSFSALDDVMILFHAPFSASRATATSVLLLERSRFTFEALPHLPNIQKQLSV